jgi:acyl carrier protein
MHQDRNPMSREEFLLQMDEILNLQPGTLRGPEKLEDVKNWDSTALIGLILLADANLSEPLTPEQVVACSTVEDLLRLAQVNASSA